MQGGRAGSALASGKGDDSRRHPPVPVHQNPFAIFSPNLEQNIHSLLLPLFLTNISQTVSRYQLLSRETSFYQETFRFSHLILDDSQIRMKINKYFFTLSGPGGKTEMKVNRRTDFM